MGLPFLSSNSSSQNWGQLNDINRKLANEQVAKVFNGPNGLNAATFGRIKDLGYGFSLKDTSNEYRVVAYIDANNKPIFKISEEGYDASTASDANLIFNSDRNIFKIIKTDTFTIPALDAAGGANDTSTTLVDTGVVSDAPLAYVAYVVNDSGGYNQLPLLSYDNTGFIQLFRSMAVELSGGTVRLRTFCQNYTGFPTTDTTVKYYLYSETVV